MTAKTAYYDDLLDALPNPESFSILVSVGVTRAEVEKALEIDPSTSSDDGFFDDIERTGWSLVEIPGGVLATEPSGYGDPSLDALRALSGRGRSAAAVRSNIDGALRFGAARDGQILFDDDDFAYLKDPGTVPAELRPLFDLAWDDLESPTGEGDLANPLAVAFAMADDVTGVQLDRPQITRVTAGPFHAAPSMRYVQGLDAE